MVFIGLLCTLFASLVVFASGFSLGKKYGYTQCEVDTIKKNETKLLTSNIPYDITKKLTSNYDEYKNGYDKGFAAAKAQFENKSSEPEKRKI